MTQIGRAGCQAIAVRAMAMALETITTGARYLARRVVDMEVHIHKITSEIARRYGDIAKILDVAMAKPSGFEAKQFVLLCMTTYSDLDQVFATCFYSSSAESKPTLADPKLSNFLK
jgi:hypothetical protein